MKALAKKRILVIKLRAIGDTVILTSFLEELRKNRPSSHITVLAPANAIDLLTGHPAVDSLVSVRAQRRWLQLPSLLWRLGRTRWTEVYALHAGSFALRLARLLRTQTLILHHHDLRRPPPRCDVVVPGHGVVMPITERDGNALRAVGMDIPQMPPPRLLLTSDELDGGAARLAHLARPVLGVGLGASRETKQWPIDHFVQLTLGWVQKTGGSCLLVVGPGEETLAEALLAAASSQVTPRAIVTLPAGSLRKLAAALANLDVFVGNDSGPRHIAAAVGTPTVTLFGPENPLEWHPYDLKRHPRFFIEDLTCRTQRVGDNPAWCGVPVCTEQGLKCLRDISADKVLAAAIGLHNHRS